MLLMATFTDDELEEIRTWVPWDTVDSTLDDAYDRLGSKWAVIVERLRYYRAEFIRNPAQLSLGGEYSRNVTANIAALTAMIAEAQANLAAEQWASTGGVAVARLTRTDPVRDRPW